MDLPSSLNSAFYNARTAVGEPAQGVDKVGLCSVMCYLLYLKHDDALAKQLCGFVSCSSQGSYCPNVNVMVPDTVRRLTCA